MRVSKALRFSALFVLLLIAMVGMVACNSKQNAAPQSAKTGGEASKQEASKQPERITVAYPGPTLSAVPFYIATQVGFAKEEGLAPTLIKMSGGLSVKALIAGEFDFVLSPGSASVSAIQGAPVRVVMAQLDKALFWLYAKPNIKSVNDLVDKKVGVAAINSADYTGAKAVIVGLKGDPAKVNFVALGGGDKVLMPLKAGAVDASSLSSPYNLMAEKDGFTNLGFAGDYTNYLMGGVATTPGKVKQRPDLVKHMIRAAAKGAIYMKKNRTATVKILQDWLKLEPDMAGRMYDTTINHFNTFGVTAPEAQQAIVLDTSKLLEKSGVTVENVFDLEIAKQVAKELADWQPTVK